MPPQRLLATPAELLRGRIHQQQVPTSRAFREDFTLVKMVPTWLRYFDAHPESFSIVETPLL